MSETPTPAAESERPFASLESRPHSVAELARAARFAITLQRVAAALGSSLERAVVLDTIVRSTLAAVDAVAGAVTEISEDGEMLHVVCAVGYSEAVVRRFGQVPVRAFAPVDRLVRERALLVIGSQAEFEAAAPEIAQHTASGGARVAVPLATADRFFGVLVLTFADSRDFAPDERDFLLALAHHCATALERARHFAQEQRARTDAEVASATLSDSLDRMSDLYFVCDAEGRYLRMNQAMRALVSEAGFQPETLIGRVIWEVFPRLVGGDLHQAITQVAARGGTVPFSARGTYVDSWYEGNAFPLREGVAVHAHDLTVRRRAEEEVARLTAALDRRVREMEAILEVVPVGIGIANDRFATRVTANPTLATLLRISPDDNASKSGPAADSLPFRVLREGHELPPEALPLQLAAESGRAVPFEEQELVFEDGAHLTLLSSAVPFFDDVGGVRGSVGAFVDITARKRAETASNILSDAGAAFASSLDTSRTFSLLAQRVVPELADVCVIFVVRESGSVGVESMESTDAGMFEHLQAFDRLHPVDSTPTHPVWYALRENRSVLVPNVSDASIASMLSGEQSVIELARTTGTTSLLMVPIAARGRVLGVVGMGTRGDRRRFDHGDLTLTEELARRAGMALDNAQLLAAEHRARGEAESARADAERASRAKSDFLAMMSHELRTPLNAIAGYAELIELGLRGPVSEGQVADLQKIRANQRHLLGLINAVLTFARLDAGRVLYDIANVPVAASLRAVQSLIEPQLRERQIEYGVGECVSSLAARADGEKLQQILLNLLANAIKFTAPGGCIGLSCDIGTRSVHLHVTDTGVGIPAEHFEDIFEPFVQANRTLRRSNEGVGLGLAISRELARGMGGEVSVQSAVGLGSTFTLTLPRGPNRIPLP